MADPRHIKCRKWTVFCLSMAAIIITVFITIIAVIVVKHLQMPADFNGTEDEWKAHKELAKDLIIAGSIFGIAIQFLGLFGAYTENYYLTLIYAVLMTLSTIYSLFEAIQEEILWIDVSIDLVITKFAYFYAFDLKKLRNVQDQTGWTGLV